MADDHFSEDYLAPLLGKTPSSVEKLLAAWDGLSLESQIRILLEKSRNPGPHYLHKKLLDRAFKHDNAYIRYLAICEMGSNLGAEKIAIVQEDPSNLVRFCVDEHKHLINKDPAEFFAKPHDARLASARTNAFEVTQLVQLVEYAVDSTRLNKTIFDIEIFELILEYIHNDAFKRGFSRKSTDGATSYLRGQEFEAIWSLLPKVPENISFVLLENLPANTADDRDIPEAILNSLSQRQLKALLDRADVKLLELRRRIFLDSLTTPDGDKGWVASSLRTSAVEHNCEFSADEMQRILSAEEPIRKERLEEIALHSRDLRLAQFQAVYDALECYRGLDYYYFHCIRRSYSAKLGKTPKQSEELLRLRLYTLASRVKSWTPEDGSDVLRPELSFLKHKIVAGDVWRTYCGFVAEWLRNDDWVSTRERFLPGIPDVAEIAGVPESGSDEGNVLERVSKSLEQLVERLDKDSFTPEKSGGEKKSDDDILRLRVEVDSLAKELFRKLQKMRQQNIVIGMLLMLGFGLVLLLK